MRVTAQAKKDKMLADLKEVRKTILNAVSSLPQEKQDDVFLGMWSVKDLLAHLAGWDFTNVEAVREILAYKLPSFYSHHDRDWKSYNAHLVAAYKKDRFADLLASLEHSQRTLIDFLSSVPAEEFARERGLRFRGYKVTIARLLQAEIDDEKIHHSQIEAFKASADR